MQVQAGREAKRNKKQTKDGVLRAPQGGVRSREEVCPELRLWVLDTPRHPILDANGYGSRIYVALFSFFFFPFFFFLCCFSIGSPRRQPATHRFGGGVHDKAGFSEIDAERNSERE